MWLWFDISHVPDIDKYKNDDNLTNLFLPLAICLNLDIFRWESASLTVGLSLTGPGNNLKNDCRD